MSLQKWQEKAPVTGPKVIKLFSYSTQLRLIFILLINDKIPTIVDILTFISRINYQLFDYFNIYEQLKFHAQLSELEKFYNLEAWCVKICKSKLVCNRFAF